MEKLAPELERLRVTIEDRRYAEAEQMIDRLVEQANEPPDTMQEFTSPRPGGYATAIRSSSRLVSFLYLLMRDVLPAGEVERLVCMVEHDGEMESAFSNDFLAAYALELGHRLRRAPAGEALAAAHRALRDAQERA